MTRPLVSYLMILGVFLFLLAAVAWAQQLGDLAGKIDLGVNATWVKTGWFSEANPVEYDAMTIVEPYEMKFIWGTDHRRAEQGTWRLTRPNVRTRRGGTTTQVLAQGVLEGHRGFFTIDLKKYLPPSAPESPLTYHVQVMAQKASYVDHSGATTANSPGKKIPAQNLGFWSAPVVITYRKDDSPPTKFDFPEVYRKVAVVLDEIILISDNAEPGREEHYTMGFAMELFLETIEDGLENSTRFSDPGHSRMFGPYRRVLNPPEIAYFGNTFGGFRMKQERNRFEFDLAAQGVIAAPRRILLLVSLLERDGGGEVQKWSDGVKEIRRLIEEEGLLELGPGEIDSLAEKHKDEEDALGYVVDGLKLMKKLSSGSGFGGVVAMGQAAAGEFVSMAMEAEKDDYYGTKLGFLTLDATDESGRYMNNHVATIHAQLPGHLEGSGKEIRYVTETQDMTFYGAALSSAAASWDGSIRITYHWEFFDRGFE